MKRFLILAAIVFGVGCSHPTPPPPPPPTPLQIVSEVLPRGTVGQNYIAQLHANGGVPPYTWTATDLPPGVTINSEGLLYGVPTAEGSYTAQITVKDSAAQQAQGLLKLIPQTGQEPSTKLRT